MSRPISLENVEIEYFAIRGRAEPIRLILEDHGIPYTQKTVDRETWPRAKLIYANYPFNQTPIITVNGQRIAQQDAILRYITRVLDAIPPTFEEETYSDMIAAAVEDLNRLYNKVVYNSDYLEMFKDFLVNHMPRILGQFEHLLNRLPLASPPAFIEGSHPCFAEYTLFHLLVAITTLQPTALDKLVRLKAWFSAFGQRKGIRAYIESDRRPNRINGTDNGQNKIMD